MISQKQDCLRRRQQNIFKIIIKIKIRQRFGYTKTHDVREKKRVNFRELPIRT